MTPHVTSTTATAARRSLNPAVIWSMVAVVSWVAIASLGLTMFNATPRIAAFDLALLVEAGRDVAAGLSPYDPALLRGLAPDAVDLFYSYPPIVAQVLSPVSGMPLGAIAVGWSVVAIVLFVVAVLRISELVAPGVPRPAVVAASVAVAAITLPLLVAILFGNLDAVFPAVYGFALVAALSTRRRDGITGGIAIALGALTKIYPAGLGLWFLVRAARVRDRAERRALLVPVVTAAAAAVGVVALSAVVFGPASWLDYSTVASTAARAEIVDGRNAAPAAQLALWIGADSGTARVLHLPVVALAVLAIVIAAWRVGDPVLSLAIAATASLFLLPISWIHYPAALLPFGAAAVLRARELPPAPRRAVQRSAGAALGAAALSIVWMPSLWIAIAFLLLAVRASTAARGLSPQNPSGALRTEASRP
jgi:Glycosyltransferase family 87